MDNMDEKKWYKELEAIFKEHNILPVYEGEGEYEDSRLYGDTPSEAFEYEMECWSD